MIFNCLNFMPCVLVYSQLLVDVIEAGGVCDRDGCDSDLLQSLICLCLTSA